jgi:small conductance mechanosensitive channel
VTILIPSSLAFAAVQPTPSAFGALNGDARAALTGDPTAWRGLADALASLSINLAAALLILLATLWAAQWLAGLVRRALGRIHAPNAPDQTVQIFVSSLTRWLVIVVGLIAVLQTLGVQTTSILAVLGAASLAVGLALQGALSNVAAGVIILILRPYRIGEVVEINGKLGTVMRLDLFVTELSDPDNVDVYVPNGKVLGEVIVNYSRSPYRRMELNFNVDYDDDVDVALGYLIDCAKADARVLPDPKPWSGVTALAQNSVTVTLRAWTPTDAYWDARFDMLKRVKQTFEAGGLLTPYPHQITVEKTPRGPGEPPAASTPSSGGDASDANPATSAPSQAQT